MDATPLSASQLAATVAVAVREIALIAPAVASEIAGWKAAAAQIPCQALRGAARSALERKRLAADGAGLFSCLAPSHDRTLLRALVALEVALDYLDSASELPAADPIANGHALHAALVEAVDGSPRLSAHYRFSGEREDGGYLAALVRSCQAGCASIGGFPRIAPAVAWHARRLAVQAINHDPDPVRRRAAMQRWAERAGPRLAGLTWFEATAAASSTLAIHALLAVAADPGSTGDDIQEADEAYMPWVNATSTFLDAFVDQRVDAATGDHNYLHYYGSGREAASRVAEIVHEAVTRARALRRGERHALIVSGMVAMYLSHAEARSPELRAHSREIRRAAGSLQYVQLPVMRIFRAVHGLRNA